MLELRAAARRLRRSPLTASGAVLLLAIGIGAATLLFAIVDGAILRPWPYEGFDRIVTIRGAFPRLAREGGQWSVPETLDLMSASAFDGAVAGRSRDANLTGGGRPERVHAVSMTASGWTMLGATPLLGRVFAADEDRPGAAPVAVMGEALWRRRFDADPSIAGRTVTIDGQAVTVVGVMPRRFVWWGAELWFPLAMDARDTDRGARRITVQGRRRGGVTLAAATAELDLLARRWEREHALTQPEYRGLTFRLRSLVDDVLRGVPRTLALLLGAVGLVLVALAANLGNLLLARAASRRGELAVRAALGASRRRLVAELAAEALLLAAAGGALGLLLARAALAPVLALIPFGYIPAEADVSLGAGPALFASAVAALSAVLVSLLPAREALRAELVVSLASAGRSIGGRRDAASRRLLVAAETAIAVLVLAAAGGALRGFASLTGRDPGFAKEGALTLTVGLPQALDARAATSLVHDLSARLAALPGVSGAGAASGLPLSGGIASRRFAVEGRADADAALADADVRVVTPGWFAALGVPLRDGRGLEARDGLEDTPVALVNETLAKRFLGGTRAAGARVKLGAAGAPDPWLAVAGVVADVSERELGAPARPTIYLPYAQRREPPRAMTFVVRGDGSAEALAAAARAAIAARDPELPVLDVVPLSRAVADSLGPARLALVLLAFFAAAALAISGLGLFAVLAASVARRTREIGVRVALGARPAQLFRLVLAEGLGSAGLGLAAGLAAALAAGPLLSRVLEGARPDPLVPAAAAAFLALVSLAACALPARRAMRLAPADALRSGSENA